MTSVHSIAPERVTVLPSSLKISPLRVSDNGMYTCLAHNRFGSDTCSGFFAVRGEHVRRFGFAHSVTANVTANVTSSVTART